MRGVLLIGTTGQSSAPSVQNSALGSEQSSGDPQVLTAFQKGACGSCHIIAGIPNTAGVIASNLLNVHLAALKHFDSGSYKGKAAIGECMPNIMPATLKDALTSDRINSIVKYLDGLPAAGAAQAPTTCTYIVRDPEIFLGPPSAGSSH